MRSLQQRLGHGLGVITAAIHRLDRLVAHHAHHQGWQANAALLVKVRAQVLALGVVADTLERTIIDQRFAEGTARDEVPVEGVGVVTIHRTANRKSWDHEGLAGRVLDAHLIELGGETPDPWEVQKWLLEAAAPSYWRVGVLKALSIPVDEFCETTTGRRTVQIT